MSGARNKPSVKAVANLVQVGVHSDGGSLYLRVRPAIEGVTRAWVFVLTVGGKRCEYGLGSAMVKPVHPVEKFTSMAPGVRMPMLISPILPQPLPACSRSLIGCAAQFAGQWDATGTPSIHVIRLTPPIDPRMFKAAPAGLM